MQAGAHSSCRGTGSSAGMVVPEQALHVPGTYMLCGHTPCGSSWCLQSSRPRTGTSNLLSRRALPPAAGRPRSAPPAPASLEGDRGTAFSLAVAPRRRETKAAPRRRAAGCTKLEGRGSGLEASRRHPGLAPLQITDCCLWRVT